MQDTILDNLIPSPRNAQLRDGHHQTPLRIKIDFQWLPATVAAPLQLLTDRLLQPWIKPSPRTILQVHVRMDPGLTFETEPLAEDLASQSYELSISGTITLTARALPGFRNGFQTLRQLLDDSQDHNALPFCRIRDWPRIATRGIHVDLAREMEYRPDHLHRVVENLASLKLNTLHLYLENKFVFASAPELAPPGAMTARQAAELCRFAELYGITVIPQLATMGHMEHLLHGRFADLREDPANPYNICPSHPGTRPFLAALIADAAAAFRSPYIHVGYDESHSGVCARCKARGTPGELLADHLNWLNTEVKRHGARTMIYGDKFLSRETFPRADAANGGSETDARKALRTVNRDIIITDWHYTAPYAGTVAHLVKEGFEVHITSASNMYWHDSIPLNRGHHWIVSTLEEAFRHGATGAINSNWEYYRGQFLDNYWYFQGLVAERGWTDVPHDFAAWGRRFAARFWGVPEDYYSELAGLAETLPTGRRRFFVDTHVLAVEIPSALNPLYPEWRQIRFDHTEAGDYLIHQVERFRDAARRNVDTLRLLDIHGHIARYLGVRAVEREKAVACARKGDRKGVLKSLATMRQTAVQVLRRLEYGYRIYGGAVQDRARIQIHIDDLDRLTKWAGKLPAKILRTLTLESLIAFLRSGPETGTGFLRCFTATALQPVTGDIRHVQPPADSLTFQAVPYMDDLHLVSILGVHGNQNGLIYLKTEFQADRTKDDTLLYGADGPVKVWVNGAEADCRPDARNPAVIDQFEVPVHWRKGTNEIVFALHTNHGKAWGIMCRCKSGQTPA